jgi:hypothetical protein
MWVALAALSAIFFVEIIPKIYQKILSFKKKKFSKSAQRIAKIVIILVIVINLGVSFRTIDFWVFEQEYKYEGYANVFDEFLSMLDRNEMVEPAYEQKLIGEFLAKQPGIEDSIVMTNTATIPYYANSKYLHASFIEGNENDPIEKFITRENWSLHHLDSSNLMSNPSDRYHLQSPIPDYIVYTPAWNPSVKPNILSDPKNPNIPSNFELIYKSSESEHVVYVVYKIHHGK